MFPWSFWILVGPTRYVSDVFRWPVPFSSSLRRATMPSMCAGANWVGKQWLGGFMVSVSPSKWWVHPISDPNHFKYAHYVPRRMNHYVILRPIMAIMLLISKSGYRKLYIYICIPKYPWNQHIINRHIYLVCWELQWICCMGLTQMGTVDLAWPHPLDQKLRISWKLAPRCSWMWSWKKKLKTSQILNPTTLMV